MIKKGTTILMLLGLLLAASCTKEIRSQTPDGIEVEEGGRTSLRLCLKGVSSSSVELRSPSLSGSEDVMTGATAYVFYCDNGLLDSVHELSLSATAAEISVPYLRDVNIYVVGNFWAVDKTSGLRETVYNALGADFPSNEEEFKKMVWRVDGRNINSSYRFERLSEVKSLGIPFAGMQTGVSGGEIQETGIECRRLFAKLSLSIDHSSMDSGSDLFRNVKLHIRQANSRIMPFDPEGSKALTADDIMDGDYDPDMSNTDPMTYEFYVPENLQGDVLPGNSDQSLKCEEQISSRHGAAKAALLSYVEFTANINPSEGGYGGDVAYRFYLGNDAVSNCDVVRNMLYEVKLGFRVSSLFEPCWQVSSQLQDLRSIGIAKDAQMRGKLPDGQLVAVRKNRPAQCYVYINNGSSTGLPSGLRDPDYEPSGLADNAFTTDFLSETNDASDVPLLRELQAAGIQPAYDPSTGLLSFTVTDPALFEPGRQWNLTLRTVPQGKTCRILLRCYENMSLSWEKPLSENFYEGASNTLSIRGFAGDLKLRAGVGSFKYKASTSMNANFIPIVYKPDLCKTSGNSLTVYRMFEPVSTGRHAIYAMSLDSFNDGTYEYCWDFKFQAAIMVAEELGQAVQELDMVGNSVEFSLKLTNPDTGKVIPIETFQEDLLDVIYGLGGNLKVSSPLNTNKSGTYVEIKETGEKTPEGYPKVRMYRALIGNDFPHTGARDETSSFVSISYGYCGECALYEGNKFSARLTPLNRLKINVTLLPLVSDVQDLGFQQAYHDYSLCNPTTLDAGYTKGLASDPYVSSGNLEVYLKSTDDYSFYVVPKAKSSLGYSEGRSESVRIEPVSAGGPLKLYFADDGSSTRHSAGPHSAIVSVRNRYSNETLELPVADFDVYVDFLTGLSYNSSSINVAGQTVHVFSQVLSDITRTSFGQPQLNTGFNVNNVVRMYYGGSTSEQNFTIQNGNDFIDYRVKPLLSGNASGACLSYSSSNIFQTFKITPQGSPDPVILMNFLQSLGNESSDCHQRVAVNLGRNYVNMQFANPQYWNSGDQSAPKGLDVFDMTAFGDLFVNPSAVQGDDDYQKGYYVFHRLGDVKRECSDWIPYYRRLTM